MVVTNTDRAPRIGTAGWSIPRDARAGFASQGSQLERYGARMSCVEINSTFYRPHRAQTYARWAAAVPAGFRFAVKVPRAITHECRLRNVDALVRAFLAEIGALGPALGPVLIQLPPSLRFEPELADAFLGDFSDAFAGETVIEPRHPTWFSEAADERLVRHRVGRVGADPPPAPGAEVPGGWPALRYWRLHGSPQMYHTPYGEDRLRPLAVKLSPGDWCIFDNTASGAALADARRLMDMVGS